MLEQRFEYKVTVIIPVYNAEKTLSRTMESLFAQTIAQGLVEILLIDDGSKDGSPALCDAYAEGHENVRVIHQENKGVSAARNAGIRTARGKYFLYLDSDDSISPITIENVSAFFDAHYDEIDVAAYPNAFCYPDGRKEYHYRKKLMPHTGVYDVEQTWYINLTTPNVMVKNRGSRNLFFDESLAFHEDEAYLADLVMLSGRLGYVQEADYWYLQHSESTTSKYSNPYYIFDSSMGLYERLITAYSQNGAVSNYIQALVLNDFNWKIAQNKLFPLHKKGNALRQDVDRIRAVLSHIDVKMIADHPVMPQETKYMLYALRGVHQPFVEASPKEISILSASGNLGHFPSVQVNVNQALIQGNELYMLGYIKCPAFTFCEDAPRLFAVPGKGRIQELSLFDSQFSIVQAGVWSKRCFAFHFSYPLTACEHITFQIRFRGQNYPTHIWYPPKSSVHPDLGCRYLKGSTYGVLCSAKELEVVSAETCAVERQRFEKVLWKQHKKWWLARQLMKCYRNQRVWLYFDSHNSLDNGYYQFLHDIEKQDGVRRYYVYHADNPKVIEGKFSGKAKQFLVAFGSVKHKCLMAAADKVLTAFVDRTCWLPFDPDTYQYYADLFHYEVVYLQHGVMHAKLPHMYSKEKVWQVNKVVVSTAFEKENLLKLGYREQDILTCGMPRLDQLAKESSFAGEKKVLFAPSWRVNLVQTVDRVQVPVDAFYASKFYKQFLAFLRDPKLRDCLEKNDLHLDIQIHPMFFCYNDCFRSACTDRIRIVCQANAADYLACITDFSSLMFDFLYLDKPVISFFPDRKEFEAGSHSYNDFYYPIEDGFALYHEDGNGVVKTLEQLAQNGFALPPEWAQRARGIYYSVEGSHADALYRCLKGDE